VALPDALSMPMTKIRVAARPGSVVASYCPDHHPIERVRRDLHANEINVKSDDTPSLRNHSLTITEWYLAGQFHVESGKFVICPTKNSQPLTPHAWSLAPTVNRESSLY